MPNSLSSINLVTNKQISFIDRFMNWTLTVGRLIVILTEIIALLAFVYRFSLDEKLIDLHSAIKQKQSLISLLKQNENKYRNLQDRIATAATFSEKSIKSNQAIRNIASLTQNRVKINDLILNKDRENIHVDVTSVSALVDLVDSLKNNPGIKSISIDNIESKPTVGLSVDITIMFK